MSFKTKLEVIDNNDVIVTAGILCGRCQCMEQSTTRNLNCTDTRHFQQEAQHQTVCISGHYAVQGHSRSWILIPTVRSYTCDFLLVNNTNLHLISHHFPAGQKQRVTFWIQCWVASSCNALTTATFSSYYHDYVYYYYDYNNNYYYCWQYLGQQEAQMKWPMWSLESVTWNEIL